MTERFAAEPLLLAFATQNGAAESIAEATLEQLEMGDLEVEMIDFYDLDLARLKQVNQVLFVTSTTLDGVPPDMAEEFCDNVMAAPAELSHLRFGLLALGDHAYDFFCGFGHRLNDWLLASGARPFFDMIEVDDEDEDTIEHWFQTVTALMAPAAAAAAG